MLMKIYTAENNKLMKYFVQVVARELDTKEKKSSTATVTIDIEDMNDNAPVFEKSDFTLAVKENTSIGTSVAQYNVSKMFNQHSHLLFVYFSH